MAYTNSKLIFYTKLGPNHFGQRTHSINRITLHCMVDKLSAESIYGCFISPSRQTSCDHGIGKDGRISLCVEEKSRNRCSSSNANDQRAVTTECANDMFELYTMSSAVYNSLIKLYVDICRRNGKKELSWLVDKNRTLKYIPELSEMVLITHRWFVNKSCPGNWLYSRLGDLAIRATSESSKTISGSGTASTSQMYRVCKTWSDSKSQLGAYKLLASAKKEADENTGYKVSNTSDNIIYPIAAKPAQTLAADTSYKVQIDITNLNIHKGPGTDYGKTGQLAGKGVFIIVQEAKDKGATSWGRLKSGTGWISLDLTRNL